MHVPIQPQPAASRLREFLNRRNAVAFPVAFGAAVPSLQRLGPYADGLALALILAIKAWFLGTYGIHPSNGNDGVGYIQLALQFLSGEAWTSVPDLTSEFAPVSLLRMPGYPLLIAAAQLLAGDQWIRTLIAVQILASTLATYMLYRTAAVVSGLRVVGFVAALIFTLSYQTYFERFILTDSLYSSVFTMVICFAVHTIHNKRGATGGVVALIGLSLAALFLMREMTLALAVGAAPLFALLLWRKHSGKTWVRSIALVFMPLLIALAGVLTWNMIRVGEPILTTGGQLALPFAIARAQTDGPAIFTGDSILDQVARKRSTAWEFNDAVAANIALFDEYGMLAPQIARLATKRYLQAWLEHPLAMYRYSANNAAAADLLLVSEYVRSALNAHAQARYIKFAQRLFTLTMVILPFAWTALAVTLRPARPYFLLVGSLAFFSYVTLFSYALIHLEQRYLLPVIPAVLLILSISVGALLHSIRSVRVRTSWKLLARLAGETSASIFRPVLDAARIRCSQLPSREGVVAGLATLAQEAQTGTRALTVWLGRAARAQPAWFCALVGQGLKIIAVEFRTHARLDVPLLLILTVYAIACVPLISRATENAQLLTCFIDDEAPLTMALDGMRVWPFGDPQNFLLASINGRELPDYWGSLRYGAFFYYGGTYLDLAFLVYGPLHFLGAPAFPTAPIILRTISTAMGFLALMVLYNFTRLHAGRIAAVIAAVFLLTDAYFLHYSLIIHPDSTQFVLALLALVMAVRHVENGDMPSLAALGLLAGLVQGAKMGGPWLIPMVALAATAGLWRQASAIGAVRFTGQLTARGMFVAMIALFAYFISTPYALLQPEFFRSAENVWTVVGENRLTAINYLSWLSDLWIHFGWLILLPALLGAAIVLSQGLLGKIRWPLILALVLGLSQLLWFTLTGKLWVELGYMLCLFAVIGIFIGVSVEALYRPVFERGGLTGRGVAIVAAGCVLFMLVGGRWWNLANIALHYRLIDSNTVIQIGRWAETGPVPRTAKILWDNVAYFDPKKFPNARMRGDLLSYNELYHSRPDYIVLSSTLYESRHYAELRRTQHYTMQNEGPSSVRLYQDLLDMEKPGRTRVPGIEFVRGFSSSPDRREDCPVRSESDFPYETWLRSDTPGVVGSRVNSLLGNGAFGAWWAQRVAEQLSNFTDAGMLVDAIRGRLCVSLGPQLRLYRIHPPGMPNGFSEPLASSERPGHPALAAFDGDRDLNGAFDPSYWMPSLGAAVNSFVGFDFGDGGEKSIARVRIDWASAWLVAAKVEIQYGDGADEWFPAGFFDVAAVGENEPVTSEHPLPPGLGAHRLWRLILREVPPDQDAAIRELRFLE